MAPAKSRPQRFAEFKEKLAKDYDPEAEGPVEESDDSQSEGGSDELDGTEHYVSVGKSKLRQTDPVSLGPQYSGKRVSRAALDESGDDGPDEDDDGDEDDEASSQSDENGESESEEFDDPETADLEADQVEDDEEIDSDEALGESDEEKFSKFTFRGSSRPNLSAAQRRKRPTATDFLTDSEEEQVDANGDRSGGTVNSASEPSGDDGEESQDDSEPSDSEDDADSLSGIDDDEEDEKDATDGTSGEESDGDTNDERAELRKIMNEGQKSIVATMSEAAKADAEKGRAVRQQRRSFDSLLNIRIRLQKALVAVNSLSAVPEGDRDAAGEEPYQAAEEAALKLWSTIETFRQSLAPASSTAAGQKRKREVGLDTPLQELWDDMEAIESRAASHRKKVLEKWSEKVRSTTAVATSRKLGNVTVQPLTSVLDDQLVQSDRLLKRTRIPRSCAPVQAARKVQEDAEIYDDADFYQLLLKELVDQRTMDSSGGDGGGAGSSIPTVRWGAAAREAKTRKVVDRRASKGRKLRFTVHEKLQNFMAPEDRRSWEQDAIDRFFGTLFGQKMELREDDGASEDEEMGGASLEEQGLRLFR